MPVSTQNRLKEIFCRLADRRGVRVLASPQRLKENPRLSAKGASVGTNAIDKPERECLNGTECTTYLYNARGLLEETRHSDGTVERTVYDPNGNVIETTTRDGLTTRMVYDAADRLVTTIHPDETPATDVDNPRTTNVYDKAGRVTTTTDERGHTTRFEYDDANRRTRVIDALNRETVTKYDLAGRRTEVIDAKGRITKFVHADNGQLLETIYPDETPATDADNPRTKIEHDSVNRESARLDENQRRREFGYDALGRLTAVRTAVGTSLATLTAYGYNEQGHRLSQTDAEGRTTRWTYDRGGRALSRALPLGQTESSTYDAGGRRDSQTDFNGKTTRYEYDAQQWLSRIVFPDNAGTRTFTYTADGQRDTVTDASGTVRYGYDVRRRLQRITDAEGREIELTYDAAGNVLSRISASQSHVYAYDALNRMTSVTATRDGEPPRTTRYEYDEVGNRTAMLHDDGARTEYVLDVRDRLTNLTKKTRTGETQFGITYTLDASGLRTRAIETDAQGAARDVGYEYDSLKRLTQETVTARETNLGRTTAWTYDKVGNRLTQTLTPASGAPIATTYVYDANDRLTSETIAGQETRYIHDANGNTRSKIEPSGTTTYVFDAENRLIEATTPSATLRYVYNADGIRTKKIETTANGTVTSEYLVDPTQTYAQVLEEWRRENGGSPTLAAVYAYGAERISQTRNGVTSFFHADGLGSTRLLTDAAGNVTDRYVYTAFGELDAAASTMPTANEFLFAGEQHDAGLNLYNNRARYMDPRTGRFVSMDRFLGEPGDPITLNKFAYANAAPTHYVDPSGYFSMTELNTAVAATAMLVSVSNVVFGFHQNRVYGRGFYYHDYKTDEITVCTTQEVSWCSVEEVWEWMRRMPAPRYVSDAYLAEPLNNEDTTCCIGDAFPLFFGGQIAVEVGPYYVNNVTTAWHTLAYGRVDRMAYGAGGAVKIRTRGFGENRHAFVAWANDRVGPLVFNGHDQNIRQNVLKAPLRRK